MSKLCDWCQRESDFPSGFGLAHGDDVIDLCVPCSKEFRLNPNYVTTLAGTIKVVSESDCITYEFKGEGK